MDTKAELRAQARDHRARLRPEGDDIEQAARAFQDAVAPQDGQIVAAYWPVGSEFDVRYIIDDLLTAGHGVALPVTVTGTRVMRFRLWDGRSELVKAAYGAYIPDESSEEVDPDIIIVPFLAFDRRGYRLGQGGGHYDATLEDLRRQKQILAVGVGYAAQAVLFNLPAEPHDQRLDLVITPAGVHDFRP